MKSKYLMYALNDIDADMIADADCKRSRFTSFAKWGSLAAGTIALLTAGALLLSHLNPGESTSVDGIERTYKDCALSQTEIDVEWLWEYKTVYEKFPTVTYNGKKYTTRSTLIQTELLGSELGICTAEGYDSYTEQTYTEQFEIRSINGISSERILAVSSNGQFYVYFCDTAAKPISFGELLDAYSLTRTLRLLQFSTYEGYREKGYYSLTDDSTIWEILTDCRDARLLESDDYFDRSNRSYISFTVTSESLGVYKRVFYVSTDGYVSTNIFDYAHTYFIGAEAAEAIINHAKINAVESTPKPYEYSLAGTLIEIGDGYILIDDTPLCKNSKDGKVFKILTDDIRLRRCIVCTNVQIGNTVVIKWKGDQNNDSDGVIVGAHSMSLGILTNGDIAVLE